MAEHDQESKVQRAPTATAPSADSAGAATHETRLNVMRHRRAAMRKAEGKGAAGPQVDIPEGGGQKLPGGVQKTMEKKLGADLSGVKVHTGGDSASASEKLSARAFTVGSDVHFNAGQFDPASKEGTKLLAHELTHVVQGQKGGVQKKEEEGGEADAEGKDGEALEVSDPEEPAEQEADAVADEATADMGEGGAEAEAKGGAEAGGEAAEAETEAPAAETEEAAPEAGAKVISRKYSASALRKVLRKKAFRDDLPTDDGADAEAAAPEAEAKPEEEGASAESAAATGEKPAAEGDQAEAAPAEGAQAPEAASAESKTVAAKLKGVHRKIFRAPNPPVNNSGGNSGGPPQTNLGGGGGTAKSVTDYPGSYGKYGLNFEAVKGRLLSNAPPNAQAIIDQKFTQKKDHFFEEYAKGALEQDDAVGKAKARENFGKLETEIQEAVAASGTPERPAANEGQLYSGYAGGRRAKDQVQQNATNQPGTGGAPRYLEATSMGMLFDSITKSEAGWIPWDDSVEQWWHQISGSYAKNLEGVVNADVRVSVPYQFYKGAEASKSKAQVQTQRAQIEALYMIPDNVFSTTELTQIHELIRRGRVKLNVNLTVDVGPGVSKTEVVKCEDAAKHPRASIDEAIRNLCNANQCADKVIAMAGLP